MTTVGSQQILAVLSLKSLAAWGMLKQKKIVPKVSQKKKKKNQNKKSAFRKSIQISNRLLSNTASK